VTGSYLFALGVVALVMGGAFALIRIAQARGLSLARVSPIRILGQQSLGMGASVVLVDVDGARVLVGVSKAGIAFTSARTECSSARVAAEPIADNVTSFSAVLKRAGSWR
jgi:flagellar biogenesis protein FliO